MRRICVIGCSGAGKSELAVRLGDVLGLRVVHLDRHFWRPGWEPSPRGEWWAFQEELVRGDAWILDGNDTSSLHIRPPRADTVVLLDYPRGVCLWRAAKRATVAWGRVLAGDTRRSPAWRPRRGSLGARSGPDAAMSNFWLFVTNLGGGGARKGARAVG